MRDITHIEGEKATCELALQASNKTVQSYETQLALLTSGTSTVSVIESLQLELSSTKNAYAHEKQERATLKSKLEACTDVTCKYRVNTCGQCKHNHCH